MSTTEIAWEPTVPYPENKASVREDIFYNPYLAVLGTIPNAENAGKVRNIFNEAKQTASEQGAARFGSHEIMTRANHRELWAFKWLEACGEPTELANTTPPTIEWEPTLAYSDHRSTVVNDITTIPYLAVLGTVPHADRADEVRFILKSANADASVQRLEREGCEKRLASAENRIIWAAAWLVAETRRA
jgi:hypothetical protein